MTFFVAIPIAIPQARGTFHPKQGKEAELLALVKKHEPCVAQSRPRHGRAVQDLEFDVRKQRGSLIEYFQWKDGNTSDTAHQTPEVMAFWEPMGPVLEELVICEVEPA